MSDPEQINVDELLENESEDELPIELQKALKINEAYTGIDITAASKEADSPPSSPEHTSKKPRSTISSEFLSDTLSNTSSQQDSVLGVLSPAQLTAALRFADTVDEDFELITRDLAQSLTDVVSIDNKCTHVPLPPIIAPLTRRRLEASWLSSSSISLLSSTAQDKLFAELDKAKTYAGTPTCAAVHTRHIAVGTSRGLVFLFDPFQALQAVLGSQKGQAQEANARGPVLTLDFSPEGEMLVAGHRNGNLCLWEVATRTLLRVVTDFSHAPVTCVVFTRRAQTQWVAVDLNGVVSLVTASRGFLSFGWTHTVQCLIQGKAGPVLSAAVLHANPASPHAADAYALLALATEACTLLVALEPTVRIVARIARDASARAGALPSLAWKTARAITLHGPSPTAAPAPAAPAAPAVPANSSNPSFATAAPTGVPGSSEASAAGESGLPADGMVAGLTVDEWSQQPLLAVARSNVLQLFAALPPGVGTTSTADPTPRADGAAGGPSPAASAAASASGVGNAFPIRLERVGSMVTEHEVVAAHWLNNQLLLALTDRKVLLAIDATRLAVVDELDLRQVGFAAHELFRSATQTERCYATCVGACDTGLFLLGLREACSVRLLQWADRVALLAETDWPRALAMALDIYYGSSGSVIGLPADTRARQRAMGDKLVDVALRFTDAQLKRAVALLARASLPDADVALTPMSPLTPQSNGAASPAVAGEDAARELLASAAATVTDFCCSLGRLDLLFRLVAPRFAKAGHRGTRAFAAALVPYLLRTQIRILDYASACALATHLHASPAVLDQCLRRLDALLLAALSPPVVQLDASFAAHTPQASSRGQALLSYMLAAHAPLRALVASMGPHATGLGDICNITALAASQGLASSFLWLASAGTLAHGHALLALLEAALRSSAATSADDAADGDPDADDSTQDTAQAAPASDLLAFTLRTPSPAGRVALLARALHFLLASTVVLGGSPLQQLALPSPALPTPQLQALGRALRQEDEEPLQADDTDGPSSPSQWLPRALQCPLDAELVLDVLALTRAQLLAALCAADRVNAPVLVLEAAAGSAPASTTAPLSMSTSPSGAAPASPPAPATRFPYLRLLLQAHAPALLALVGLLAHDPAWQQFVPLSHLYTATLPSSAAAPADLAAVAPSALTPAPRGTPASADASAAPVGSLISSRAGSSFTPRAAAGTPSTLTPTPLPGASTPGATPGAPLSSLFSAFSRPAASGAPSQPGLLAASLLGIKPQQLQQQQQPPQPSTAPAAASSLEVYASLFPAPVPSLPVLMAALADALDASNATLELPSLLALPQATPKVAPQPSLFPRSIASAPLLATLAAGTPPASAAVLAPYATLPPAHSPLVLFFSLAASLLAKRLLPIDALPLPLTAPLVTFLCRAPDAAYYSQPTLSRALHATINAAEDPATEQPHAVEGASFADPGGREHLVLQLVSRAGVAPDALASLTAVAEKAGFRRVSLALHKRQGDVGKVLAAYTAVIDDLNAEDRFPQPGAPVRPCLPALGTTANPNALDARQWSPRAAASIDELFAFLATMGAAADTPERRALLMKHMPALAHLSPVGAARVCVGLYGPRHEAALDALDAEPALQFEYLAALVAACGKRQVGEPVRESTAARSLGVSVSVGAHTLLQDAVERQGVVLTPKLNELYIGLLCRFAPDLVRPHLATHANFDLDRTLKLCLQHRIAPACAYLYERVGDWPKALELHVQALGAGVNALQAYLTTHAPEYLSAARAQLHECAADEYASVPPMLAELLSVQARILVQTPLTACVDLCQRATDSEKLWFVLLEALVTVQLTVGRARRQEFVVANQRMPAPSTAPTPVNPFGIPAEMRAPLSDSYVLYALLEASVFANVSRVLQLMAEHVPLRVVLGRVIALYQDEHLGSCRHILQTMLDTHAYERSILASTKHLLQTDLRLNFTAKIKKKARAFTAPMPPFPQQPKRKPTATINAPPLLPHKSQTGTLLCSVCRQSLDKPSEGSGVAVALEAELENMGVYKGAVCVRQCGHAYHYHCLTSARCQVCLDKGASSTAEKTTIATTATASTITANAATPTNDPTAPAASVRAEEGALRLELATSALEHVRWMDFRALMGDVATLADGDFS